MSYQSEHKRLKPVLDLARRLDIATNPDPAALFEAGNAGFQVWCTPDDHPKGWEGVEMIAGTFSKPCEYLGSVHWKWEGEQIAALEISTTAYALADHKPGDYSRQAELPPGAKRLTIHNRDADIHWLIEKITWLFDKAGLELPPCEYEPAKFSQIDPHTLARFVASDGDEYLVIVSPDLEPEDFCNPGYVLTDTLEIWQAGDFPADLILRPEPADFDDSHIEPDEGPLTEQYENACRLGDDDWLEAAYEDSISGWDE